MLLPRLTSDQFNENSIKYNALALCKSLSLRLVLVHEFPLFYKLCLLIAFYECKCVKLLFKAHSKSGMMANEAKQENKTKWKYN